MPKIGKELYHGLNLRSFEYQRIEGRLDQSGLYMQLVLLYLILCCVLRLEILLPL